MDNSPTIFIKSRISNRCENISALMQQVQQCPWNPFKLNEVVTLEKCLLQVSLDDPRVGLILGKLANDSVFVEPVKKLKHLIRSDNDKKVDRQLEKKANSLREDVAKVSKEIDYYMAKLEDLSKDHDDTCSQIIQLNEAILSWEQNKRILDSEFGCKLDVVVSSFDRSIQAIKFIIPNFIVSLPESNLVRQFDMIPARYRSCLINMMKHCKSKQQQVSLAQQLSFCQRKIMLSQMEKYMKSLVNLYRDLVTIHRVYSTEVLEELEHMRTLETHLEYLEKPIAGAPKLIQLIHHNNTAIDILRELPAHIGEPFGECEDGEYSDIVARSMEKLKLLWNCVKGNNTNAAVPNILMSQ